MAGKVSVNFVDYSDEQSRATVHVPAYTAVNFTAQQTLVDSLVSSFNAVSLLNELQDARQVDVVKTTKVVPSDKDAQREKKWLVRASDDVTGKPVQFTIPGADLSLLTANTDKMDISGGVGATLVTDIEAVVTSDVGNAVTVADIVFVGRNI